MRTFVAIICFIIAGLAAAVFVGFGPQYLEGEISYDAEQQGLQDRIVIQFSHVVAENTPKGLAAEYFAKRAKELTRGRVEVQVFPNSILYSDENELKALTNGDIQMIAPAYSKLSEQIPAWMALDLPFAFVDQQAVNAALQGDIGRKLMGTLEGRGMKGLAFWPNGFKQMTSSRQPLLYPEDFQGQRFRIMPSKVLETQYAMLGAKTVSIPFSGLYRGLELGEVDGQENTVSNIYTRRLNRVQQYMTVSNHGYLGYTVIVNKRFWNGLPEDIRSDLEQAMRESTAWMLIQTDAMNRDMLARIKEEGHMKVDQLTAEERAEWIHTLDPIYDQFEPIIGTELVELIREQRMASTP